MPRRASRVKEPLAPVRFEQGRLILLDQRKLPTRESYLAIVDWREAARAIRDMVVRGAPAIGLAGAYGVVLAGRQAADQGLTGADWRRAVGAAAAEIAAARPTAVNLEWAVQEVLAVAADGGDALLARADALLAADVAANRQIGRHGGELLPEGCQVLTHCNAGALATGGYGTALGVVRWAWQHKRLEGVYATETRPVLQGARLTAWELRREGIPVTLVVDGAAAALMAAGRVAAVVVGADRIAANGDTANKIGTYGLAVAAAWHKVPFYVAAPRSTLDPGTADGRGIQIEQRDADEVSRLRGRRVAPRGVTVDNPAFDVTPAGLITGIITESGLLRPPYDRAIAAVLADGQQTGGN